MRKSLARTSKNTWELSKEMIEEKRPKFHLARADVVHVAEARRFLENYIYTYKA